KRAALPLAIVQTEDRRRQREAEAERPRRHERPGAFLRSRARMQGIETETAVTECAIPLGAELVPELIADDGWTAPGWREAAIEYHKNRGDRVSTTEPRNWSIRRRSKSSRTASDSDSPVGFAITASRNPE